MLFIGIILKCTKFYVKNCIKFFYNLICLTRVENILGQKIQFPFFVRNASGTIKLNGKNTFESYSSIVLTNKNSEFVLEGNAQLQQQSYILCNGGIHLKKNGFLSRSSQLLNYKNKLEFGENFKLGKEAMVAGYEDVSFGTNFNIGNHSKLIIQSKWLIGDNTIIAENCSIFSREPNYYGCLKMGNYSQIGPNSIIDLCEDVVLEEGAILGPNCVLYTHNHEYSKAFGSLGKGTVLVGSICIGKNTWIGANVIILPNVKIGDNVVIGAGSVITKDIEDNTVYAGNPARKIKEIKSANNA